MPSETHLGPPDKAATARWLCQACGLYGIELPPALHELIVNHFWSVTQVRKSYAQGWHECKEALQRFIVQELE